MSDFVWNCFVFHFPPNPVYLVCANSSIICLLKQILSLHPFWSLEIIILLCSICRQHKKKIFPKIFLHLILYSYFLVWVPAKRSHTWWNNKITSKKIRRFLKKKKIRLKIFPQGNIDRHLLKNFFWKLIACSTNEQKCVFGVWIRRINFLSGWDWIANSFSVEILLFFSRSLEENCLLNAVPAKSFILLSVVIYSSYFSFFKFIFVHFLNVAFFWLVDDGQLLIFFLLPFRSSLELIFWNFDFFSCSARFHYLNGTKQWQNTIGDNNRRSVCEEHKLFSPPTCVHGTKTTRKMSLLPFSK